MEIPRGRGASKAKFFEMKLYDTKKEFPEGWGIQLENPSMGLGMDIFWNNTIKNMIKITQGFCPGGYSIYPWVGRCSAAPHTLTLIKTNIADFPTLFKTEFRFLNTPFKTFNPNIN